MDGDGYLPPDERERRARRQREQLTLRGLTPDGLRARRLLRVPPGLRVGIIGGGLAGLAAAWYLRECGVATTVFEAGARVGGRVDTDRAFAPGKIVEAGAELIGENHPLWGSLARRFELPLVELTGDEAYEARGLAARFRFGCTDLTPDQKREMNRALQAPLAAIGADALTVSETEPWRSPRATEFDRLSVAERLDQLLPRTSNLARQWLRFTLGNDNCADIAQQSYLGLLAAVSAARMGDDPQGMLGYWFSSETHRCGGGNDQLATRLAAMLPDLRLRTRACQVRIDAALSRPVRIGSTQHDDHGAVVRESVNEFDFAVLAVPPGTWNAVAVTPPFDPARRTLQHGPAVKFLSEYATGFWERHRTAPSMQWDELGSVWEGTDTQADRPGWVLTVFSGGPCVLAESAYAAKLAAAYPPTATTRPEGQPIAQRFVDWPSMPFIRTGYAVPAVNQVTTICSEQLRPHAQRLYFAGEQTSSGFFGYMEGALQSGARAARDIVIGTQPSRPARRRVQRRGDKERRNAFRRRVRP